MKGKAAMAWQTYCHSVKTKNSALIQEASAAWWHDACEAYVSKCSDAMRAKTIMDSCPSTAKFIRFNPLPDYLLINRKG